MRTAILSLSLLFFCLPVNGEVIALWNFNSVPADANTATGVLSPAAGAGTAAGVGAVTTTFATGAAADPAASDNSGWNTSRYANAGSGNLSAGGQFNVDTSGYEQIQISWSQRNSATASRYTRFQYTVDGSEFVNADVVRGGNQVFTNIMVDLSAAPGVADNPQFAFRLVAEMEASAMGSGIEDYVATEPGSTYNTSGTVRFDMVTVSGTPGAGNTPPSITAIGPQSLRVGAWSLPLAFEVSDLQDDPALLTVWGIASDASVVANAIVSGNGPGGNRALVIQAGDVPGAATVTLTVTDSGGRSSSTSFEVVVLPVNTPPTLVVLPRTNLIAGASLSLAATVNDLESGPSGLTLAARSENQQLVRDQGLSFSASGSNGTLTISSLPGTGGIVRLVISASDGGETSTAAIGLLVAPTDSILLQEDFDYRDGSLLARSGYWQTRSGVAGQAQVAEGALLVSSKQTEDVVAPLGGPCVPGTGAVVYASFQVRCHTLSVPPAAGLLAHFSDGNTLRGRVYVSGTNSPPGAFRFLVANGAGFGAEFPRDFSIGESVRVVTRYEVDSASTTLWAQPEGETDTHVVAVDPQPAVRISNYGFRQDADLRGDFSVDALRVSSTFPVESARPRLEYSLSQGGLLLKWSDAACRLESSTAPVGPWQEIPDAASPFQPGASQGMRFFRLAR